VLRKLIGEEIPLSQKRPRGKIGSKIPEMISAHRVPTEKKNPNLPTEEAIG